MTGGVLRNALCLIIFFLSASHLIFYEEYKKDTSGSIFSPFDFSFSSLFTSSDDFGLLGAHGKETKKCFYEVLQVKKSDSKETIKRSYRRLSMQYHPDKNNSEDAKDIFSEIASAYEVLSSDEKRKIYDKNGHEGIDRHTRGESAEHADPFDIFSSFFGGGGGHRTKNRSKSNNVNLKLFVTLEQLYFGESVDVKYDRPVVCMKSDECTIKNKDCHGPGIKISTQQFGPGFVVQNQVSDPTCVENGKKWLSNCKQCPNGQTENKSVTVIADISPGMTENDTITFQGIAPQKLGSDHGDLVFSISTLPHSKFIREGDDLHSTMRITLLDSLTGFIKPFLHIDTEPIILERQSVTPNGFVLLLHDKGMPIFDKQNHGSDSTKYGKLFITFAVEYPKKLNSSQMDMIKKALPANPHKLL